MHSIYSQLTSTLYVVFQQKIGRDVCAGANRTGVGLQRDSDITYERPMHVRSTWGTTVLVRLQSSSPWHARRWEPEPRTSNSNTRVWPHVLYGVQASTRYHTIDTKVIPISFGVLAVPPRKSDATGDAAPARNRLRIYLPRLTRPLESPGESRSLGVFLSATSVGASFVPPCSTNRIKQFRRGTWHKGSSFGRQIKQLGRRPRG